MAKSKGRLLSELSESPKNEDYSDVNALPVTGNKVGDQGFVEGSNRLYIWNGSGWYNIALINTTPTWDSNGQPASSYELSADSPQTTTSITLAASDPEGIPIQYSYVTSGQMDSIATISQDSSVFTITPKTSTQVPAGGTGSITFRASDGINILPAVSSFTLNFITTVDDSKYTVLLATATGTSDNNNITDSSSSSHSITVNGAPYAGTFSPYRSGGYSHKFDGTGTNYKSTLSQAIGNDLFTVEFWYNGYLRSAGNTGGDYIWWLKYEDVGNGNGAMRIRVFDDEIRLQYEHSTGYPGNVQALVDTTANVWRHYAFVVTGKTAGSQIKIYVDGVESSSVVGTDYALGLNVTPVEHRIGASNTGAAPIYGYLRDFRISNIVRYSANFTPSTETLTADSDTLWLGLHNSYLVAEGGQSITVHNGENAASTFSPYNYNEYDVTSHGGSIYFPVDTGARLSSASSSLELGTGNFTIEGWIYHKLDGSTSSSYLFDYRTPPNSGSYHSFLYIENSVFKYGYGAYSQQITSGTVKENTWYHWAVCRSGTNTKLFLNGKQAGSTFTGDNVNYQGQQPYIGRHNNVSSLYAKGYLSDVRITKSDLYTADFTPPTAPLASTNSVLHMKGTDASIIDKSQGANLELVGNTTGSSTTNFTGAKSMYFDGTGDGIVVPHRNELNLDGCDWTIEFWYNVTNPGAIANWNFISKGSNASVRPYAINFRLDNSNGVEPRLFVSSDNSSQVGISNNAWQTFGNWHHVAFVRIDSTGVITRYINGTANGTATSDLATNTEDLEIGTVTSGADEAGYIQDLRISKGKAHYTANFTPPSALLKG